MKTCNRFNVLNFQSNTMGHRERNSGILFLYFSSVQVAVRTANKKTRLIVCSKTKRNSPQKSHSTALHVSMYIQLARTAIQLKTQQISIKHVYRNTIVVIHQKKGRNSGRYRSGERIRSFNKIINL